MVRQLVGERERGGTGRRQRWVGVEESRREEMGWEGGGKERGETQEGRKKGLEERDSLAQF